MQLKRELKQLYESLPEEKKREILKLEDPLARFEKFLNIVRGKVDIKYRLRLLLDPDNVKTTTRLSASQVDFVFLSYSTAQSFPEAGFGGLGNFATEFCLANISLEGKGRLEAIEYEGAGAASRILERLNIFKTEETKAGKA